MIRNRMYYENYMYVYNYAQTYGVSLLLWWLLVSMCLNIHMMVGHRCTLLSYMQCFKDACCFLLFVPGKR